MGVFVYHIGRAISDTSACRVVKLTLPNTLCWNVKSGQTENIIDIIIRNKNNWFIIKNFIWQIVAKKEKDEWTLQNRSRIRLRQNPETKVLSLTAAVILLISPWGKFWNYPRERIGLLPHTTYPQKRNKCHSIKIHLKKEEIVCYSQIIKVIKKNF